MAAMFQTNGSPEIYHFPPDPLEASELIWPKAGWLVFLSLQLADEAIFRGIAKNNSNDPSRCRIKDPVKMAMIPRPAYRPAGRPMSQSQSL
jgi:hypothetical protein